MKTIAFAFVLLVLLSFAFAENYTSEYVTGGWLKVSRLVVVGTGAGCAGGAITRDCSDTGAVLPDSLGTGQQFTSVFIGLENVGPVDREGVVVFESLSYLPEGAKTVFSPSPSSNDGRNASWQLGSLRRGESKTVAYSFQAKVQAGQIEKIPEVSISALPATLAISAPQKLNVGDKGTLSLRTLDGQPVPNVVINVEYPDGSSQPLSTDSAGVAFFTASSEGVYTYSLEGYTVAKPVSTEVRKEQEIPAETAAAAIGDAGLLSALSGALPLLAAIFAIAFIALVLYNFLAARRSDEAPAQASPPGAPGASQSYTQKFTFSQDEGRESQMRSATRGMVESRKRQQQAESVPEFSETTVSDDEPTARISKLEEKARLEGELSKQEEEIERTITELESIRQKLQQRKESMGTASPSAEKEETEEQPKKTEAPRQKYESQKSGRVPPPKGKKLRFAGKPVKRK